MSDSGSGPFLTINKAACVAQPGDTITVHAGQKGATRSIISGNFIEDTNYSKEFGGWETAAIKFHNSVDTDINGKKFAEPIAGPMADIQQGKNTFEWMYHNAE